MNSLASYYFLLFETETQKLTEGNDESKAHHYFQEGMRLSNEMGRITYDIQAHVTRCFTYFLKGELGQACKILSHSNESGANQREPLVLLAQAIIAFNQRSPKDALPYVKRIAEMSGGNTPPEIWLVVGILYFKMKNLPKAKFALEHVLELQPDNPMAMTSLAIVELQINYGISEQRLRAVELFHRSFELDDTNPLTMKHLAEHFFFTGELEVAESLCNRAI